MEIVGSLLNLLTEIGKFVNFEKQNSVQNRILELRAIYDNEISKGTLRDDALIYSIRIELRDICELYCAVLKGQTSKN